MKLNVVKALPENIKANNIVKESFEKHKLFCQLIINQLVQREAVTVIVASRGQKQLMERILNKVYFLNQRKLEYTLIFKTEEGVLI